MKIKNIIAVVALAVPVLFSSCIKQLDKTFQGASVVEFDATVLNSATTPYTYHVTTRVPTYGYPTPTSAAAITRTTTTPVKLRVNLVGAQKTTDQTITYKVLTDVAPASPNQLAVSGTHYTTGTSFVIPANSSFGEVVINILNTGTSSTTPREVHLELVGNESIKPSENYKRVGIRIAQN